MNKKLKKLIVKNKRIKFILNSLFLFLFIFNLNLSYAKNCGDNITCNCGDTIISDYVMNSSLICNNSNGLYVNALNLDCNNFSIIGKVGFNGLTITGGDNINIKNCNINNFTNGLIINKRKYLTGNGWGTFWYEYDDAKNIRVFNSTFKNNLIGISSNGKGDQIFSNIFRNNFKYGLDLNYISNIYNNKFYNTSIHYSSTSGKNFCNNNIGNFYFNTSGPNCNCIELFDNLLINSNIRLCPKNYSLNQPLKISSNSIFNCNNANLINNGSNIAIKIPGEENINIINCNFYNFSTAIYSYIYFYKDNQGFNIAKKPIKINISNNYFYNNLISINLNAGYKDKILNNSFINDKYYSIKLEDSKVSIFSNLFKGNPSYNESIIFSSFKTKFFCEDNISNIYLENTSGPTCDCIIPKSGLNLDISAKFCKGNYNLTSPILVSSNVKLDCNGASFFGNKNINAINLIDSRNTLIKNCNFENFKNGVFYSKIRYGYYNNSIINNSFLNLINGIYLKNEDIYSKEFNQRIINNTFINLDYGIYNEVNRLVEARYNIWQTNNISKIKLKILNSSNVIFIPFRFFTNKNVDLSIEENSINFDFKKKNLNFKILKNNFYYIDNFDLKIFQFRNNTLINEKKFNISGNFTYKYLFNLNYNLNSIFNFNSGDKIKIILDYDNNLNEINENNNLYNFEIKYNPKIFVEDNSYGDLVDSEFNIFLKFIFEDFKFTNNKSEANIIINIVNNKDSKSLIKNTLNYLKLNTVYLNRFAVNPYEGKVLTYNKNNIQNIILTGEDIEGNIASIKELARNKDKYLYSDNIYIINRSNIYAIKIYDYLHSDFNRIYFKKRNDKFQKILRDVLYDDLYRIEEIFIPIKTPTNQTINYKMQRLIPQYSDNLLNYINKNNSYPIIMGGGLWSDISTWSKLGGDLANDGLNSYLIEITGGKNSESNNSYNYPYEFLTDEVFPAYISKVQEISNSTKIKYIGHSNGARVALDSLSDGKVDQNDFDILITVGVPGSFEDMSYSAKIIKYSGDYAIKRLKILNITHPTLDEVVFYFKRSFFLEPTFIHSIFSGNKISLNLFKKYFYWINSSNDLEPGRNISVNKFILIGGNKFFTNNDLIVSIEDEKRIFNNVNSTNKKYYSGNFFHMGMSENKRIMNIIKKNLN